MEKILVEKTASRGIAAAPVYVYQEPDLSADTGSISKAQEPAEVQLFLKAKKEVVQ